MSTRKAISGWLKDADQIPGHELVRALAAEHDELLNALELAVVTIERIGTRHGPFSSFDGTLDVANAAIRKAKT